MFHFDTKSLVTVSMFTSLALSAGAVCAEPLDVAESEPLSPEARSVILNDARTRPSAEAASTAMKRGVETPELDVESPNGLGLASEAAAAASCELADVTFEVGSAELTDPVLAGLSPVAECLKNQRSLSMWIIGEADARGSEATNWVLAMERAMAVKEALRSMGVNAQQLLAVSAGVTGERSVSLELSEVNPREKVVSG